MSRLRTLLATAATATIGAIGLVLGLAEPAAAVTAQEKLAVLSNWTQTSAASQNSFLSARANQGAWSSYGFDWATDYCSSSPDNPLGFDFVLSCVRHDFGYRNYKLANQFPANKSRLDSAFYEDLKRKCATYSAVVRPACNALAWTYYQAVKAFGSVIATQADLDRAAALVR
jgi:Prokaryotic phospholipase A2